MPRTYSLVLLLAIWLVFALSGCSKQQTPASSPASTSKEEPRIDPATSASISGAVRFVGTAPSAQKIDMSADSECKGQNQSELVVVNNGRLANVLVYVKEGLAGRTFSTPSQKVTITQQGCRYIPHVAGAMVGQPIEFVDDDDTMHNIHPIPKNNKEWNQSQMPKSDGFTRTFDSPEIMIPIKCNQHPWMKMYLSVMSNPYYAVTSTDGSFELTGLPPGTYTIAAVHEKYGEQEMKITLAPKDIKQGVSIDFHP